MAQVLISVIAHLGISMLTLALLLSAAMGLVQETLYKRHGKHPGEALYYNVSGLGSNRQLLNQTDRKNVYF